jgi:hypothetical protein
MWTTRLCLLGLIEAGRCGWCRAPISWCHRDTFAPRACSRGHNHGGGGRGARGRRRDHPGMSPHPCACSTARRQPSADRIGAIRYIRPIRRSPDVRTPRPAGGRPPLLRTTRRLAADLDPPRGRHAAIKKRQEDPLPGTTTEGFDSLPPRVDQRRGPRGRPSLVVERDAGPSAPGVLVTSRERALPPIWR